MHRTSRPSVREASGTGAAQSAPAWPQRLRNAQPEGSRASEGVMPGICRSGRPGALLAGTESSSPRVYG
jgi:hypothetical protein